MRQHIFIDFLLLQILEYFWYIKKTQIIYHVST